MNQFIDKIFKQKIIVWLILYLFALGTAEFVIAYYSIESGVIIHTGISFLLIVLSAHTKEEEYSELLQGLALASLIRILSTSLPLIVFLNLIYIFIMIYFPLLLSAFLFLRSHKITMEDAGITGKKIKLQIIIGLSGLVFGVTEYFILKEYLPITEITNNFLEIINTIIIVLFVGFTEELIFSGIILSRTTKILSANKSIIFVSILFMLMHMGWHSPADLAFIFAVGLFYCYVFVKTGSIIGITLSHGLTNVIEYIIIPTFGIPISLSSFLS